GGKERKGKGGGGGGEGGAPARGRRTARAAARGAHRQRHRLHARARRRARVAGDAIERHVLPQRTPSSRSNLGMLSSAFSAVSAVKALVRMSVGPFASF